MNEEKFLADKIKKYDLVLVNVIASIGVQSLRAKIEKIYSSKGGVGGIEVGSDIEFVHAPANWGRVALAVGDRTLLFMSNISGKLYEHSWNGHLLVEDINGETYAIYPEKELWKAKDFPEKIRRYTIQDPKRSYATAIRFDQLEGYLQQLSCSGL